MSLTRYAVKLIGTVDEAMLKHFIKCVNILVNKRKTLITVVIHSGGGDAMIGLAISEYMRLIRTMYNVRFQVTALGDCSSAATIILVSGDNRYITKESWVMVHEDSGEISGNVTDIEVEVKQKRRMEDQWTRIFEDSTRTSWQAWEKMNKETTYLSAQECLMLGLVDEVV